MKNLADWQIILIAVIALSAVITTVIKLPAIQAAIEAAEQDAEAERVARAAFQHYMAYSKSIGK